MKIKANCKINIGLRVVRKRADGYHDIDTVFYPVYGLYDELEIIRIPDSAEGIEIITNGIPLDCSPDQNLIYRCYQQMADNYPIGNKVIVTLDKHIPFGAGLGGGSSDAAHTAILLNDLFHLHLSRQQLADEVKSLGADCPFFIFNTPCHATGIGDELVPVDFSLAGKRLLMIKPENGVSTKEAYSGLIPSGKTLGPVSNWKTWTNDFEKTVFAKHPEIEYIKKRLIESGAEYAAMSGSGSTVFGLFQYNPEGRTAADLRILENEFASMIIFNDTL